MKETVRLRDFFRRYDGEIITIIGSGGKTALLWFLARCFAGGTGPSPLCGKWKIDNGKGIMNTRNAPGTAHGRTPLPGTGPSGEQAPPGNRPCCRGTGPEGASGNADRRVLVTTTTKMGAPDFESGLFDHFINGLSLGADAGPLPAIETAIKTAIEPGITFAGNYEKGAAKTAALPPAVLSALIHNADVTLIEGDGSKTLPLKGWADHEPVIPPPTTVTVGVIPLWPLGMPVTEAIVHRLPLFCALTGAGESDILTTSHLAAAISGLDKRRGLFTEARGKRALFFNQAEDEDALRQAGEIMEALPAAFKARLDAVIAGSVKWDRCAILR
ncbi:MAG: putative selenium-dependent hydroxylase accessory protein YqeC [Spirochaetaceae bacterium]|nr:putative selenium-dependent hydroxylase accessory protein YqeC [Spirochaetaceae bacterium]